MAAFGGDGFQLSKWFNTTSVGREHGAESRADADTDTEDDVPMAKRHQSGAGAVAVPECHICGMPNPDYMSTNTVKKAPPVPVCSTDCESKYLEQKGLRPSESKAKTSVPELDNSRCYVCHVPNPEYMSTNAVKWAPSVPVCGVDCESEFLKGYKKKDTKANAATKRQAAASSNDNDEKEAKRPRRPLSFLDDQLLESEDVKGYKSWWLGALAFYNFVYQRHGMWHHYTMSNETPRVDPLLMKFATCNIYRELDRSTAYLRKHVIRWQQAHHGRLSLREVLWMSVVFRFCNKLETFDEAKGIPSSDEFMAFKKRLLALAKRKHDHVFLAGKRDLNVHTYLDTLEAFLEKIDACTAQVKHCFNTQEVFGALQQFNDNALGSFTCWQVVADLLELNILGESLELDDFVWLSSDAKKSLTQIFGARRARPNDLVDLAKVLQQRQSQGFKALQVQFPYFLSQKLNLKNIGHALHGFQQYRNMKLLEKKQFHKQGKDAVAPVLYTSRSYFMDSESCEICLENTDSDKMVLCDMCNGLFHTGCINMKELPPASWVCEPCKILAKCPEEGQNHTDEEVISID